MINESTGCIVVAGGGGVAGGRGEVAGGRGGVAGGRGGVAGGWGEGNQDALSQPGSSGASAFYEALNSVCEMRLTTGC